MWTGVSVRCGQVLVLDVDRCFRCEQAFRCGQVLVVDVGRC